MTDSSSVLFRNCLVVDAETNSVSASTDILVEGDRITQIASNVSPPAGANVIDIKVRHLMPGLIDCHVHPFLADSNIARLNQVPPTLMAARAGNILNGMLMRGFTSVRDAAGADWGIKKAVEDGEIDGPRLFIAGRALSQTGGHGDMRALTDDHSMCSCSHALGYTSIVVDGVDEVRRAVREELRKGADQIKIMVSGGVSSAHDPLECDQYSREEIRVIVEEATRRGTYVMAHAYGASAIRAALECGVRTIEHGNLIDKDAAKLAAESGAFLVPTLVTYAVLKETATESGWTEYMLAKLERVRASGSDSIRICREAGVKLGFGTDLLGDSFDQQSREFAIRAEVETPAQIIESATRINAEILQKPDELGVISEGAYADILVLESNPLEDIAVLANPDKNIDMIMKSGRFVKE